MQKVAVVLDDMPIARNVHKATGFFQRLKGLLGRTSLGADDGMLFFPGGSVHTIGMRCAIDVVFLDEKNGVLKVCHRVGAFRFCLAPAGTRQTLELAPGIAAAVGIKTGSRLAFVENA